MESKGFTNERSNDHYLQNIRALIQLDSLTPSNPIEANMATPVSNFGAVGEASPTAKTCQLRKRSKSCGFCRRNGEMSKIYKTHSLKDEEGIITCPFLRKHVCELCGATGDQAHTRSYCPLAQLGRSVNPANCFYYNTAELNSQSNH